MVFVKFQKPLILLYANLTFLNIKNERSKKNREIGDEYHASMTISLCTQ